MLIEFCKLRSTTSFLTLHLWIAVVAVPHFLTGQHGLITLLSISSLGQLFGIWRWPPPWHSLWKNGGNTILLTADAFSKAEISSLLTGKMDKTHDLVLASLSALNNRLVLKAGISGLVLQNTAGTQELLAVDSLGNTQIKGNLYAPNIVQTSVLAGYVTLGDFLSNLSDYFYKSALPKSNLR